MTDHELSPSDLDQPTPETLAEMDEMVREINNFIETNTDGHVDRGVTTDGSEEVHRFIVVPRKYDDEGEVQLNASTVERYGKVGDVILSVTRGLTSYYYERSDDDTTLEVMDRTPKNYSAINNMATVAMSSVTQATEAKKLGVSEPIEGSVKDLVETTRDVVRRLSDTQ